MSPAPAASGDDDSSGSIRISVVDHGIGIPACIANGRAAAKEVLAQLAGAPAPSTA